MIRRKLILIKLLCTKYKTLYNIDKSSREITLKIYFIGWKNYNISFIKFVKIKTKICKVDKI